MCNCVLRGLVHVSCRILLGTCPSVAVARCLVALAHVPKLMHVHANFGLSKAGFAKPDNHPVGNNSHAAIDIRVCLATMMHLVFGTQTDRCLKFTVLH